MADLRFEKPETTEGFCKLARERGLVLPIEVGEDGNIVDAYGEVIATVDVNREMPDAQVTVIAALIVVAVNTCGGFRADVGGAE